jgi:hypothetical protein
MAAGKNPQQAKITRFSVTVALFYVFIFADEISSSVL